MRAIRATAIGLRSGRRSALATARRPKRARCRSIQASIRFLLDRRPHACASPRRRARGPSARALASRRREGPPSTRRDDARCVRDRGHRGRRATRRRARAPGAAARPRRRRAVPVRASVSACSSGVSHSSGSGSGSTKTSSGLRRTSGASSAPAAPSKSAAPPKRAVAVERGRVAVGNRRERAVVALPRRLAARIEGRHLDLVDARVDEKPWPRDCDRARRSRAVDDGERHGRGAEREPLAPLVRGTGTPEAAQRRGPHELLGASDRTALHDRTGDLAVRREIAAHAD